MANRARALSTTVALAAFLACSACGHQPVRLPRQPVERPEDRGYDCPQLDKAIARADTVRWVARIEGARLETIPERNLRYVFNLASVVLLSPSTFESDGDQVLDSADRRIVALLRLKRARSCPAQPTSSPGITDLQMLTDLEPLLTDSARADRAALDRRTLLLDQLRLPRPTTSP